MRRLYRSESNRMVAGVAGGLGAFLGIDPTIVRLGFVLLSFLGGSGLIAYLVMWLIVPSESKLDTPPGDVPRENLGEIRDGVERGARHARDALDRVRRRDEDDGPNG
jgi:phage shock protein C